MSDLIRRDDVLSVLCFSNETGMMLCEDLRNIFEEINKIPSAEPERTAKVTKFEPYSESYWATDGRCEGCGGYLERMYNYCPTCGARLEWE